MLYNVVFMIGALMLYMMLWRARLVPRWISGWGLVSVIALGTVAVTATFVDVPPAVGVSLIVPLAVQEMVMAVWFIFRGFAPLPGRAPDVPA